MTDRQKYAFTLVEILIVVMIIGILAAIAVPKLANASQMARESTLKDNLRLLRTQMGVYRTQHNDVSPGYPAGDVSQTPTEAVLSDQLTKFTDVHGNVSATASAVFEWGPYLQSLPVNPVNGKSTWKILGPTAPYTADDTTGWLYQPVTGTVRANVSASDSEGKQMIDY